MAHDIFISYSTKDKTIADTVCAKLEEKNIRCWIAPRDVSPGTDFSGSIIDAIDASKVFVLIWSAHTNTSTHILNELNQAFDSGITIIPFRIEDIQPSKSLKYYIGRTHWLDALTPPLEQHIEKLAKKINSLIFEESKENPEIIVENKRRPRKKLTKTPFLFWGILASILILFLGLIKPDSFLSKFFTAIQEPALNSVNETDAVKVCQVTDFGGIEGDGFGYAFDPVVWDSIQLAKNNYGIEGKFFESSQVTDFEKNLQLCKNWGADLIFAVGFKAEMYEAVKIAAISNPQIYYAIVDYQSGETLPNLKGMEVEWSEGAFLAGYLSASMTNSGKVGIFAGNLFPIIQKILDGYYLGLTYFNEQNNEDIKLIGYDPFQPEQTLIMGNWTSLEAASNMMDQLITEGADVFLPVCGYVAIESVYNKNQETGIGIAIGTDYDMSQVYPQYSSVVLASIVKRPDVMVYELISQVVNNNWKDESNYLLSLENGGIALVFGSEWKDKVPLTIKEELNTISSGIKTGDILTVIGPE